MINLLLPAITGLLDKVIPDKDKAQEIAFQVATLTERQAHEIAKEQIKVNEVEAAHKSLFVSGWRPAVGWICATSLGINYIIIPLAAVFGAPSVKPLDMSVMMPVLMGMLGLGTLRTVEKHKGVARHK